MSLQYIPDAIFVGYVVHKFVEEHNHSMIELTFRRYMHLNRKLGDVHMRTIWDCTKADNGLTMTFKVLNEFLIGYDTVGDHGGRTSELCPWFENMWKRL